MCVCLHCWVMYNRMKVTVQLNCLRTPKKINFFKIDTDSNKNTLSYDILLKYLQL